MDGNNITGNSNTRGAGVYVFQTGDTLLTVSNNNISGNQASSYGGGVNANIHKSVFFNNTIINNSAAFDGGGIVAYSQNGTITLTNNTLTKNDAGDDGGGLVAELSGSGIGSIAYVYNNIIWDNTAVNMAGDIFLDGSGEYIGFNNIYQSIDGTWSLFGNNIDIDPLFVDPVAGDYHLQEVSPAVDTGDNNAPELPATDKDGNPRISGTVDLGAYEVQQLRAGPPDAAPSAPELVYPNNGQINLPAEITFKWNSSTDAQGDIISYEFYLTKDSSFDSVTPVIIASVFDDSVQLVKMGYGAGAMLFGIGFLGALRGRRKVWLTIAILVLVGFVSSACNDGGSSATAEKTHLVSGLDANTIYRWKVVATDGLNASESQVHVFKTN